MPTWLMVEGVYYCLQFGLSGLAIGLVYGKSGVGTDGTLERTGAASPVVDARAARREH